MPCSPATDFPAEHWVHLRTTNPIESAFATVRHRTARPSACNAQASTKNCVSRSTFLGLAFELVVGSGEVMVPYSQARRH
jgi:hypothetical protein